MTLYQKIPTTSARIDPMMVVAVGGVVLLSLVATAAIVGWLPDAGRAGHSPASPASASARASSASATADLPAEPAARKLHPQNSRAPYAQLAAA